MGDIYGFDYETSSEADLGDVGSYRYSNDPTTFILMFAIARNEESPLVWDSQDPNCEESVAALDLLREAIESKAIIRAFNAQMEVAVSRYVLLRQLGLPEPDLSSWRCTMAMANRAAIRSSLGNAIKDLGITEGKMAVGDQLIEIFSKRYKETTLYPPDGAKDPDTVKQLKSGKFTAGRKPKNRKSGSPVHDEVILWDWLVKVDGALISVRKAWSMMLEYCRRDVISEREVAKKLRKFELTGDELASWQFDLRFNYKGVPVNVKALAHAQKLVERFSEREINRFQNICGLKPSQTAKLLPWLQERGYTGENLQAETIEEELKDTSHMTEEGATILKMRSLLSFAALAKIPSMLACVCDDGYVRGTTLWHGARTGRATGRLIQPQNMKKATISDSAVAYDLIQRGCSVEEIAMLWESPLEVISSCCRHFIQPHEGLILDADYTGVEARIGPWLCGESGKLQTILDGLCQYKVMASEVAFDIPYDQVTKLQREVGKVLELQCIYGTGGEGMMNSLAGKGVEKTLKECNGYVRKFRTKFPGYPTTWKAMEKAAIAAIQDGTVTKVCGGRMAFGRVKYAGIVYLVMKLPSGRRMYYPHPTVKRVFRKYKEAEMIEEPWKREEGGYWADSISFYGRVPLSGHWSRIPTWGSRLFENACFTADSEVLTEQGWKKITEVNGIRVFDGVEFVSHSGIDPKFSNDVMRLDGLGVTRKHEILTSQGWRHASETEIEDARETCRTICTGSGSADLVYQGHDGFEVRVAYGSEGGTSGCPESSLGMPVRLREDLRPHDIHPVPQSSAWAWGLLLLLQSPGNPGDAWHVEASGLRRVSEHVGPVQAPHPPSISQLWRQGDLSLPQMERVFREFLGRHEKGLRGRAHLGSPQQPGELREEELPMGVASGQQPQHALERQSEDAPRAPLPDRNPRDHGHQKEHAVIPLEQRCSEVGGPDPAGECHQPVYDILNCGPRQRFLVRAPGKEPVIAHNCQAIGADLLNYGCLQAEAEGYDIRMIIHDQILGLDNGLSLRGFTEAFCRKQPWAHDFPLAASSAKHPFYLKD